MRRIRVTHQWWWFSNVSVIRRYHQKPILFQILFFPLSALRTIKAERCRAVFVLSAESEGRINCTAASKNPTLKGRKKEKKKRRVNSVGIEFQSPCFRKV